MYPECASQAPLYDGLHRIDLDLAEHTKLAGCPFCGESLDYGRWMRKPRGCDMPEDVRIRHGLCCRREGCRKRVLPPSTLFLGRRVYWAAVVLIVVVVRQRRLEGRSAQALRRMFGVTHRTLRRWITWFETAFARTARWRTLRGLVPATIRDAELPSSLLAVFDARHGPGCVAVAAFLRLLAGSSGTRFARGSSAPQKLRDSQM